MKKSLSPRCGACLASAPARRAAGTAFSVVALILLAACVKIQTSARDALAASQGFIAQAQKNHLAYCQANPTVEFPCQDINRAVIAQNLAVSALEIYCGWPPAAPERQRGEPAPSSVQIDQLKVTECKPDPSRSGQLRDALRSVSSLIAEYKKLSGGKP